MFIIFLYFYLLWGKICLCARVEGRGQLSWSRILPSTLRWVLQIKARLPAELSHWPIESLSGSAMATPAARAGDSLSLPSPP